MWILFVIINKYLRKSYYVLKYYLGYILVSVYVQVCVYMWRPLPHLFETDFLTESEAHRWLS